MNRNKRLDQRKEEGRGRGSTSRRDFLRTGLVGSTLGGLTVGSGCGRGSSRKNRPPNILYLMTDQQKASASSVNGNALVRSPFMDELARSGIVFRNAYTPSPICTPSRTSVFTGVHPLVHQVTCHQNRAPYNVPQLSELLQQGGYFTAVAGHYESERNLTRGWEEEVSFDDTGRLRKSLNFWFLRGGRM